MTAVESTEASSELSTGRGIGSLSAYLPGLVVESAVDPAEGPRVAVEPITGTLMFADISGFTPLSERLSRIGKEGAERLTDVINSYFERMLTVAGSWGGDNLKFGGDALLLFFSGGDHARRAVAAGLEMQRANRGVGVVRVERDRLKLSMSIGIHSGTVWSATAGDPATRMQHFILGNEGATLARTEGAASRGQVLVTQAVRDLCGDAVTFSPLEEYFLAGRVVHKPAVMPQPSQPSQADPCLLVFLPRHLRNLAGDGVIVHEGEHRKVTVIFISLRGLNELLDAESPAAAHDELNRYFRAVLAQANRYGGLIVSNDIDSYGLKLIIIFGAPVAHEDDAANALRFAAGLHSEFETLGLHVTHRLGVHSDYVFCGDVGSSFRHEYTVLGDGVNLSARLMSAAAPGQIIVSERAAQDAGNTFVYRPMAPLTVKGKSQPIEVRTLLKEEPEAASVAPSQTPLVGREAELATLHARAFGVESGEVASVLIVGDVGLGKSRLISELCDSQATRGWRIFRGDCHSHTTSTPFGPWVPILLQLFGLPAGASPDERGQHALARLSGQPAGVVESAPLLNGLLGLDIPENPVTRSLDEDGRRERLMRLIQAVIDGEARRQPCGIVVEDLQWADPNTIWLLEGLARRLGAARVFFALTTRPTGEALPLAGELAPVVALAELPDDAALALLRSVMGRPDLAMETAAPILAKCQGNPLFIEEVGRVLLQSGGLDSSADGAGGEAVVPDRLQSLLLSRIDSLGGTARTILRLASVAGTTFDTATVADIAERDQPGIRLDLPLADLERADMILRDPSAPGSYRFKHSLIREVAYETLLFSRRRELHRRVATHIEQANQRQLDAHLESLAHHWDLSGDAARTVTYSVLAGDKARRVFASESAVVYYRQARAALGRVQGGAAPARAAIDERIGDCLETLGREREAVGFYVSAFRSITRPAPHARLRSRQVIAPAIPGVYAAPGKEHEADLLCKIGVAHERISDYDASLRWLDRALAVLPHGQPGTGARILGARSVALFRRGRYNEAIETGRRALTVAHRATPAQVAYAHLVIANTYATIGKLRYSITHRVAALELYEQIGDLPRLIAAHGNLALSYQSLGEFDRAIEHNHLCLDAAARVGNTTAQAIAHNNLGEVLLMRGEHGAAMGHFEQTVAIFREQGEPRAASGLAMVNLAQVSIELNRLDDARKWLDEAGPLLRSARASALLVEEAIQETHLLLARRDLYGAVKSAQLVRARAHELGIPVAEARILQLDARARARTGDVAGAVQALRESIALCRKAGARFEEALGLAALAELGRVISPTGPLPSVARRAAVRSAALFETLGVGEGRIRALRVLDAAAPA
jgi:class 3 adenylate cyclase/tetratricopeptide (TPR) repeat protein